MLSFEKKYVLTGLAHELNFNIENIDNEGKGSSEIGTIFKDSKDLVETLKEVTKELIEEVEAFIIVENGIRPDFNDFDFKKILVLNPVEFEELKTKESLAEIIASAEVIDLSKD